MKSKKILLSLLVSALTIYLTVVFALPNPSKAGQRIEQDRQTPGIYSALKHDFLSKSGEKVVEVTEASYEISESGLDSSFVRVKNLSGRNVTALGLVWTVSFTDGGECSIEQLVDYKIHRDIVEARGIRPFAPDEEKFIPRLTKDTLDAGQSIKDVRVDFVFVEFDDASGVGVENSDMYRQILSRREGAELYRRWVENGYKDDSNGLATVSKKLSSDELPHDRALQSDKAKEGARIYQQWMLGILRDKGPDALREQLRAHQQLLKQ